MRPIERDPNWFVAKKKPWELCPSADNPDVREPKKGLEFRWWAEPCPEVVNATDRCPGYWLEYMGPKGAWVKKRECPDHGWRWVDRPSMYDADAKEDLRIRMAASGIPDRFKHYTLATFPMQDQPAYKLVREYAAVGRLTQSLLLTGNYGTGKTSLAVSILQHRITERAERGLFLVVPNLFAEIRASFDSPGASSNLLQRALNVPLLVLDDLGSERATEWVQEQLYAVINHRQINNKPTIVTTNLSVPELTDRLGARTMERIKAYRILEVGGPNMRDTA